MTIPPRGMQALAQAMLGLALLLSSNAALPNACSKPLAMSTVIWLPYVFRDEQKRVQGLDVDLARAIFQEAGCTLVLLPSMPLMRNAYMFSNGKVDVLNGASKTAKRMETAYFTLQYRFETVGLFVLADKYEQYRSVDSFEAFMQFPDALLAPRLGWYGPEYALHQAELKSSGRLWQFEEFDQGVSMLAAGRATMIMGDVASVAHAARERKLALKPLPFILMRAPIHLMFNKASTLEADVALINAAIKRLEERGELERIRLAWADINR